MNTRFSRKQQLLSVFAVGYILYNLVVGLPQTQAIFQRLTVYPWGTWRMFPGAYRVHTELTAEAITQTGGVLQVDYLQFIPPTNHWVLERNRGAFGAKQAALRSESFARYYCRWILEKYLSQNKPSPGNEPASLRLVISGWRVDTSKKTLTNEPDENLVLTTCNRGEAK